MYTVLYIILYTVLEKILYTVLYIIMYSIVYIILCTLLYIKLCPLFTIYYSLYRHLTKVFCVICSHPVHLLPTILNCTLYSLPLILYRALYTTLFCTMFIERTFTLHYSTSTCLLNPQRTGSMGNIIRLAALVLAE